MRPAIPSLSRSELGELLDVPLEVVDALLESGRLLCHLRAGEVRIPRPQVEQFLRDSLMRLYMADGGQQPADLPEPPVKAAAEETPAPPPPAPAPPPPPDPAPPAPAPRPMPPPVALAVPASLAAPLPRDEEDQEQRIATRYVPLRQLGGIFGDTKFVVMQLSATGLRIRHNEPLMPGEEAKLSMALLKPARSVVVRARVVWTSLASSGTERFSISGLRIVEHQDRLEAAIESLRASNELQPERRAGLRRATDTMSILGGISDEEMALVTAAVTKFANDPVEASRWYSRARFALSDDNVRRAAPERPRDREEVLGIWEYLDRQIEIGKIAGVVTWLKSGS
ncbi:MAG TPA: PilZ domain-containing protein [Thermoanaerobaculia bacterium]